LRGTVVAVGRRHGGPDASLNMRRLGLHVATDAQTRIGAMLAGLAVWRFGWMWADPVVSIVIALLVAALIERKLRLAMRQQGLRGAAASLVGKARGLERPRHGPDTISEPGEGFGQWAVRRAGETASALLTRDVRHMARGTSRLGEWLDASR